MSVDGGLSLDRLRRDVAVVLGVSPEAVAPDAPLPEQGLDSVRLMTLVERWRLHADWLTFADLAERPTLIDWADLIAARSRPHA